MVHLYLLYFHDYKLAFQLCYFRGIVTGYWATRLVLGLFRLCPSTSSGFVSVSDTKLIQFQIICLSSHVLWRNSVIFLLHSSPEYNIFQALHSEGDKENECE